MLLVPRHELGTESRAASLIDFYDNMQCEHWAAVSTLDQLSGKVSFQLIFHSVEIVATLLFNVHTQTFQHKIQPSHRLLPYDKTQKLYCYAGRCFVSQDLFRWGSSSSADNLLDLLQTFSVLRPDWS